MKCTFFIKYEYINEEDTILNEILKQLKERKSVRVFESKEINQIIKDEIIQAAFEAPTGGMKQ